MESRMFPFINKTWNPIAGGCFIEEERDKGNYINNNGLAWFRFALDNDPSHGLGFIIQEEKADV